MFTAPSRYGVDFCRVPADCSVCSEVDQVEEVAVGDLSVELFQERSEQYFVSEHMKSVANSTLTTGTRTPGGRWW